MSQRRVLLLILLAVLAGLGLAWRWSARSPTLAPLEHGPAGQPALDSPELPGPQDVDALGELDAALASAESEQRVAASAGAAALEATPREPLRLVLRGRVHGRGLDPGRAQVILHPAAHAAAEMLSIVADPDGRYEFDATAFLSTSIFVGSGVELVLSVTHPRCAIERRRVRIVSQHTASANPEIPEFLLHSGLNLCEVDVEIFDSAIVRGTLLGPVGNDARQYVVKAALPEDLSQAGQWLGRDVPREDGGFELRLPPGARYAVVVLSRSTRPVTRWIDLPRAGDYSLTLAPEAGFAIEGRLTLATGLSSEGIGLDLHLQRDLDAAQAVNWPQPAASFEGLVWAGERFEWASRTTRAAADGSFRLGGLSAAAYELNVLGVGLPGVELRAFPIGRVQAPSHGLELGPLLAALTLDLGPVPDGPLGFTLQVADQSGGRSLGPYTTDELGAAQLFLPPESTFEVRVDNEIVGRVTSARAGGQSSWSLSR